MKWRSSHARFTDYALQVFNGVEISWVPSLFGLVCECTRTSDPHSPFDAPHTIKTVNTLDTFEYQTWKLAINVQREPHVRLDQPDDTTLEALDKLAGRCFYTHLTKPEAHEGVGHSIALTYYLLLRQYSRRNCIQPEETFEYLFQRTCDRFRAHAVGLRALYAIFSRDDIYVHTSENMDLTDAFKIVPTRLKTPLLQLVIFECNDKMARELVSSLHQSTFEAITDTSAGSAEVQYDLRSGTTTLSKHPRESIKFHLIDSFLFCLSKGHARGVDDPLGAYMRLAHRAFIQYALPASFQPPHRTAFLIDAHLWYPYRMLECSDVTLAVSRSVSEVLSIRDAILSSFADACDRSIHYAGNDRTSSVQILNVGETSSTFRIVVGVKTQQASWTYNSKLTSSAQILLLIVKFSSRSLCTLRLAFPCPLDLQKSNFEQRSSSGALVITLAKDIPELLSRTALTQHPSIALFDPISAQRWPPPRLANGRLLDCQPRFPPISEVGHYDQPTTVVYNAISAMFTFLELLLSQRQTGGHIFRDADFDLRESIKMMILHAYCARLRLGFCVGTAPRPNSPTDIRTYGDILFLYEGVYNHCGRPILAVSYFDTGRIAESNIESVTKDIKCLIARELQEQANAIARARSPPHSTPSDYQTYDIKATEAELGLMRKLLAQNSHKMKGVHRPDLPKPWRASFIEPPRADARSVLLDTRLTRENGINLLDEVTNYAGCQTCKKLPFNRDKSWSKCSQCKSVFYCCTTCQAQDWPAHKCVCPS